MKKVLIEQECNTCGGEGFLNEAGCPSCEQTGIKKTRLPGDLLAEFEAYIYRPDLVALRENKLMAIQFLIGHDIKTYKPVTVLILTSTDTLPASGHEGSEVKK